MNNYLNILLISGSWILAGLINYSYHPLMLQFLSLEDFWTFWSLVGIFNLLWVLLVGLDFFFTKSFSKKINQKETLKFEFYSTFLWLLILWVISYVFFILLSPTIARFLNIENVWLLYITWFTLVTSFISVNIWAMLKSMKAFKLISIQQVLSPVIKLLLGILFLYIWLRVSGALLWFVLSWFIPLIIWYFYISKKLAKYESKGDKLELRRELIKNRWEIFHFFLMSFVFAFFMNIDVILAKNLFSWELSGIYAAITVLWKFLIFLLLSIETVYFGQIMEHEQSSTPRALIKNPLILITITIIWALLFNLVFGKFILWVLKPELANYSNLYMLTLVYYSFVAYISFSMKVLVGWKYYKIIYTLLGFGIIALVVLYTLDISSLYQYISLFIILWVTSTITSLWLLAYNLKLAKK